MLEKIRKILATELPVSIEEKITRYENGIKTVQYETVTEPIGSSYYWLVKFTNGQRIPYPILNLESEDSAPFKNGEIEKSKEEITNITEQEKIVREAFSTNRRLWPTFERLKAEIFADTTEEYIYLECEKCEHWKYAPMTHGYCNTKHCILNS